MANIGTVLKEEIARLARKETRRETAAMQKAKSQYRRDIAALKRQVAHLERQVALLERKVLAGPPEAAPAAKSRLRFTAKGLRSQRNRLGLSAADYGKLAGVTGQSIYNWERETVRPRKEQIATLAALRGMGTKEAQARLRQLAERNRPRKKRR